MVKLIR